MSLNPDQYDEVAQYAAGGVAIVALAGLMWTETIAAAEGLTIILGVLSALGAYESGRRGQKKKTNAPDTGDLVDVLLTAMDGFGGTAPSESDSVSKTSEADTNDVRNRPSLEGQQSSKGKRRDSQASQTGTPADHTAAEAEKTQPAVVEITNDLRRITGIGPTYADMLSGQRVDSVEDLATANIAALEASTGISKPRLDKWQQQASELTSADE